MRIEFSFRVVGMLVFAATGWYLGDPVAGLFGSLPFIGRTLLLPLVGALIGFISAPYVTIYPAQALRKYLGKMSNQVLFSGLIGLIVGLGVAALFAWPLSLLPNPLNQVLPLIAAVVCAWLGLTLSVTRRSDIFGFLHLRGRGGGHDHVSASKSEDISSVLLDTSAIIDGRVVEISQSGFLVGTIIVPKFVLKELQNIADSPDATRRNRGRRGLETLNRLQDESIMKVKIIDSDVENVSAVDDKLVILAKQLRCRVMTNDYNLNRVAELQGVTVLNINELANAVKAVFLPGESIKVEIIQEGKETGQGVGYLEDGTMVVVDNGRGYMKRTINVVVTKVLQTAAGRMMFAKLG